MLQTEEKRRERQNALKSEIQKEIRYVLGQEEDSLNKGMEQRMQAVCVIHESLVRQDERERRRIEKGSGEEAKKKKSKKGKELPLTAKVTIKFGVKTILSLVKMVGIQQPEIFQEVISIASEILGELPPMCLDVEDPDIMAGIEMIAALFEQILSGDIKVPEAQQLATLSPLLGLALAKGNLTSALSVASKFFTMSNSESFQQMSAQLTPMLKNLSQIVGVRGASRIWMNWQPVRQGPDITLSNENLTVTRTDSSGWGCQLSEQSLTDGIHYYEFKIDRNSSSCLLLGLANPQFTNFTSKSSGPNCYCLQSDGDFYFNSESKGNIIKYDQNDRLGLLINMEEHTMMYFKNGEPQQREPFGPLAEEVYLLSCFGGSNQFITINNDPKIPDEAGEVLKTYAPVLVDKQPEAEEEEKKETETEEEKKDDLPFDSKDIITHEFFKCINDEDGEGQLTPEKAGVFVLASLEKINAKYFAAFCLNEEPTTDAKTA